jgi:hypothetical protein
MNQEQLWCEFSTLSPQAQALVLELIATIKQCSDSDNIPTKLPENASSFDSLQREMKTWFAEVRATHPLAQKSKAEIFNELRKTRDVVYGDLYGNRHAD